MSITVRPARSEEAPALTELSMRSKQSNGYDDDFMAACRAELTVTPEKISMHRYWVAEADTICGCAALIMDTAEQSGEVHSYFVDPQWQGRGIGRLLWAALRESAEAAGLKTLILDADPHAVPFYRALGFEVIGESPSGSIPGRKIPHMKLSLRATDEAGTDHPRPG